MRYLAFITVAILLVGCNENPYDMNEFHKTYGGDTIDAETVLTDVSNKIVVFGHQSVGNGILDGITAWEKETGVSLNRQSSRDMSKIGSPSFIDFMVGQNFDTRSKVDDFISVLESVPEDQSPLIFFKFCYVDVEAETDVDEVFEYYKEKMLQVKLDCPHARIILSTVPLTAIQTGWKATAKKVLNRVPYGYEGNIKRQEINERIINELSGDFPVFDLALVESTLPDGSLNTYEYDGGEYPCMPAVYTSDSGHLNDFGAKIVSYNLLAFLSTEVNEQ